MRWTETTRPHRARADLRHASDLTDADWPLIAPASTERSGFGSRLIERGLAQDLDGDIRLDFEPSGVICTIAAPIQGIIKGLDRPL